MGNQLIVVELKIKSILREDEEFGLTWANLIIPPNHSFTSSIIAGFHERIYGVAQAVHCFLGTTGAVVPDAGFDVQIGM